MSGGHVTHLHQHWATEHRHYHTSGERRSEQHAHAGSHRWAVPTIRRLLALVTGFAGSKLLLG